MLDVRYGLVGDSVSGGDFVKETGSGAYFNDIVLCQFVHWMTLSVKRYANVASLCHHVIGVVLLCAKKQVVDIYARRNITLMQHTQSWRDRPVMYFPHGPVCLRNPVIEPHGTVPVWRGCAHPNLTTGPRYSFAATFKILCYGLVPVSTHDASTKTVDISPVSRVVARRGLQPVVPALQG